MTDLAAQLVRTVRTYFDGCIAAAAPAMIACFTPDAVHYFPPGTTFDPDTLLISEIRAYYASPVDPTITGLELDGFDHAGRGYPLTCPVPRPHPSKG